MDLRQLRVFIEIVRQGSFTQAAERLHIAQPAVSFDPPLHLDLFIAWKPDRHLSRANRTFTDFLLERRPGSGLQT